MRKHLLITGFVLLLVVSAFVTFQVASAFSLASNPSGDLRSSFTLTRSVIGSGGMGGAAEGYTIHSTLGQPVAGAVDGGSYHLTSGFWTEVIESLVEFFSFLPLIVR